ncbi:sugar MFS transporter [Dyadobacter sp. CY326]|uniref:sugar MFS transporter n=1 Tax=Dyadobacter sp. CY326 TaxID=2907300 RepID=UPI001F1EC2F0|nr:sugar MFS transporter [Dyadobacter sp. CY326]MCE7068438.1 sugar MFS transporter [Dyadobacter sp. CY326]
MDNKKSYLGPLFIIGVLFFVMGFITWVNGTLITFFKKAFSLDNTSSYLVTFAFFISYTIMAIPCSYVVKKTGFKNGMSLALLVMAAGTLIFIPAAEMASYPVFLVGLFTIGIGLTVLQTASNPYATLLGPRESAAQRISIMGIANKGAGIISQIIIGKLLLAGATSSMDPKEELDKVVVPYLILTGVLVVLAIIIRLSKGLVEVSEDEDEPSAINSVTVQKTSVFQYPNLVLGVLALFCYVGVEVIAADTIINYGVSLGIPEDEARVFGAYTLGGMMFGYVLGIVLIPKFVSQQAYMIFSAVLGVAVTVAAILTTGFTSVMCIAVLGFANAVIWPALWPLALSGLGRFTKIASALLVMGISGGAVLPLIYGGIADSIGSTQQAYWILVPLYLFILYFGLVGHKKKSW